MHLAPQTAQAKNAAAAGSAASNSSSISSREKREERREKREETSTIRSKDAEIEAYNGGMVRSHQGRMVEKRVGP